MVFRSHWPHYHSVGWRVYCFRYFQAVVFGLSGTYFFVRWNELDVGQIFRLSLDNKNNSNELLHAQMHSLSKADLFRLVSECNNHVNNV